MVVLGGWAVSYERGTPVPVVLVVFGDPGHERALEKRVRVEARSFLPCGTEAGSYLRLIHSCITQLKAQGPSRTCNERKASGSKHAASFPGLMRMPGQSTQVPLMWMTGQSLMWMPGQSTQVQSGPKHATSFPGLLCMQNHFFSSYTSILGDI